MIFKCHFENLHSIIMSQKIICMLCLFFRCTVLVLLQEKADFETSSFIKVQKLLKCVFKIGCCYFKLQLICAVA